MSFKDLKKNRADSFKKLIDETEALNENDYAPDPDSWYPGVDKVGNGTATIRFLPAINDEDKDFIRWWTHNFQDPNTKKWYIENCLFSINKNADPVMAFNKKLWDSVEDSESAKLHPNRIQATRQARKINYRSNIFVVDDGVNPENNGKVKKFKYGKWCFDKIEGLMFPKFAGKKAVNPFDLWEGSNFVVEIFSEVKGGKKQRNYTGSHFETTVGPLADEKKMEEIFNSIQGWSLKAYLDPKNFKSYDELKKHLDEVVGYDTDKWTASGSRQVVNAPVEAKKQAAVAPKTQKELPSAQEQAVEEGDNSEDFFNNLKDDDPLPF
jgi:hypothetical protein